MAFRTFFDFFNIPTRAIQQIRLGEEMMYDGLIQLLAHPESYKNLRVRPLATSAHNFRDLEKCSLQLFSLSLPFVNSLLVKPLLQCPILHNVFWLVPCNFAQLHSCNVSVSTKSVISRSVRLIHVIQPTKQLLKQSQLKFAVRFFDFVR